MPKYEAKNLSLIFTSPLILKLSKYILEPEINEHVEITWFFFTVLFVNQILAKGKPFLAATSKIFSLNTILELFL